MWYFSFRKARRSTCQQSFCFSSVFINQNIYVCRDLGQKRDEKIACIFCGGKVELTTHWPINYSQGLISGWQYIFIWKGLILFIKMETFEFVKTKEESHKEEEEENKRRERKRIRFSWPSLLRSPHWNQRCAFSCLAW